LKASVIAATCFALCDDRRKCISNFLQNGNNKKLQFEASLTVVHKRTISVILSYTPLVVKDNRKL